VWEFIEYDVLNPSDSIPKREDLKIMLTVTKKEKSLTKVSLLSLGTRLISRWMTGITDNSRE